MLKVGIIGAGHVSQRHMEAYAKNKNVELVAIADLSEALAKQHAKNYNIKNCYTDYRKILEDPEIDAVSILTPTFTHREIVVEALKAGKKVLCEKPPARTLAEVEEIIKVSEETGNFLMWAFVFHFAPQVQLLKKYIDEGKMGKIHHAEAVRLSRYSPRTGWFVSKEKAGGGCLIDSTIHELDIAMYLMGYPKVKSVLGFTTNANNDMNGKMKGLKGGYASFSNDVFESNVESMASGYVTFENGASLYVKSGYFSYNPTKEMYVDIMGEKGGSRLINAPDKSFKILSNMDGYIMESSPIIENAGNMFEDEVNHFVECCIQNIPCVCEAHQPLELMKIIEGIYRSAETGQPVVY